MSSIEKKNSFSTNDSLALKGIAIWMLMFHHCFMDSARLEGYEISFFPFSQELVINVSYVFKICVSFFAFISGYGLCLSAQNKCIDGKSTEKWMVNRIFKTLSGYWFVYVLMFIITQVTIAFPSKTYASDNIWLSIAYAVADFLGIARIMGTPSMILTWWYMGAAVVFVVAVPILLKSIERFGPTATALIIFLLPRTIGRGFEGGTRPYAFMFTVFLGMIFAKYDLFQKITDLKLAKDEKRSEVLKFVSLVVLIVVGFFAYIDLYMSKTWEFQYGLYAVTVLIFCKLYIIRIPHLDKALIYFGKHSMNVFLIHSFVRYIYLKDFVYGQRHFILIAAVLYFISLALSVWVIEPLKKWLHYDEKMAKLIDRISK